MRKEPTESPMASACTVVHQAMTGMAVPGDRDRTSPRHSDRRSLRSHTLKMSLLSCIQSLYARARRRPRRKTGGLNPRGRRRVETCAPDFNVRFIVKFTLSIGPYIGKPHSGNAGQRSNSQFHPRIRCSTIISQNNPVHPNFGQSGKRRTTYPCHATNNFIVHHCERQTSRYLPRRANRFPFHHLGNAVA